MFQNESGPDVGGNTDGTGENNQSVEVEASSAAASNLTATAPVFTFSGSSAAQVRNTSLRTALSSSPLELLEDGREASSNATSTPRGSPASGLGAVFTATAATSSDTFGFAANNSPPQTFTSLGPLTSGVDVVFVPTSSADLDESATSDNDEHLYWRYFPRSGLGRRFAQTDFSGSRGRACSDVEYKTSNSSLDSSVGNIGGLDDQELDVNVSNSPDTNNGGFIFQEPNFPSLFGATPIAASDTGLDEHQSYTNVYNPAGTNTGDFNLQQPLFTSLGGAISTAASNQDIGLSEHQSYPAVYNPAGANTGDFNLQQPLFTTSFAATSTAHSNPDSGLHEHQSYPNPPNRAKTNTGTFTLQTLLFPGTQRCDFNLQMPLFPSPFAATSTAASTPNTIDAFSNVIGAGTSVAKYVPAKGLEKVAKTNVWPYSHQRIKTRLHCITGMNAYMEKSFEELRLEDYAAGRKGKRHADLATGEMANLVESIEEVWRCPVCLDRVCAPLKMCENGHISCAKCNRQPRCPLCRARFSPVPLRALEQVLDLLPKKCRHAQFGCGTLHPLDQMQYCVYRTMRCFGPCSWEGAVKDWWDHAIAEHPTFDVSQPIAITHRPSSPEFYCLKSDADFFLFRIHAENGLAHCCARHIPTAKPKYKFVFEVTIRKDGSLLRSAVIKASKDLFDIHRMSVLSHEIFFADVVIALQKTPV